MFGSHRVRMKVAYYSNNPFLLKLFGFLPMYVAVKCQRYRRFCGIVLAWELGQLKAGNHIRGRDDTLCNTGS